MNNQKGNIWIGLLVIGLGIWGITSLFSKQDVETDYSTNNSANVYNGYSNYSDDDYYEPENPYEDGSGHSAGYEWAMENEPSGCGGNSQSFIEGCEEYMAELEESEEW